MACDPNGSDRKPPVLPQYQIREWLNNDEHSGSAHIYGYIFDPKDGKLDAEFTFGDCNRNTRILFSVYDEQSIENVRHKAAKLCEAVVAYCWRLNYELDRLEGKQP